MLVTAVLAVGLAVVAACSRDYRSELGPLKLEHPAKPDMVGQIGVPVTYNGVEFTMLNVTAFDQSPNAVPRLQLTIRTDNAGHDTNRNPDVGLHCDESTAAGEWFQGSTWESKGLLPTGEVREGVLLEGFPRKANATQYNLVSCTNARIIVTMSGVDVPQRVIYAVDAVTISEAIRRPRGPNLPLPASGP